MKAPNPPKPLQIDLNQMQNDAVAGDQAAWAAGDQYMSQYYPQLTQARDSMIGQAYGALTGPVDPSLENAFVNSSNVGSINALGSGDQGFGLSTGSLGRNASEAKVAQDVQGYQDYNRSFFENLNSTFAPRSFGLTPEDAANIFTFNTTQMNNYLQQKFGAQTQAYYQNQGQSAAAGGALFGAGASIISAVIPALIAA